MKKTALIVFSAVTLAAIIASAGPQARLAGKVTDTSGKAIPTAVITITTDEQASFEKVVEVDSEGGFKTMILDATRHYVMTVKAVGYESLQEHFKIAIGSTDRDNFFEMQLRSVQESATERKTDLLSQPGYKELEAGRVLLKEGRLVEARKEFEASLIAVPTLLSSMENLTNVLFRLGEFEAALDIARSCLEEDDESQTCLAVAANVCKELGDGDGHSGFMARYQALNPEDPATLFNQAVVFLNKMDDEKARPLLEKCLETNPEFLKCLFEYGMLLLRSGDIEGSKANLKKYIEVAPDGPDAATAAETVKYL